MTISTENARLDALMARRSELLTVGEYARMTRCCEKTISRRIWCGRQRGAVKDGGQWRIDVTIALSVAC
jgi:hypothetical protein